MGEVARNASLLDFPRLSRIFGMVLQIAILMYSNSNFSLRVDNSSPFEK